MDTRGLTGGRDRAKGWTETPDGNWTPSVYDRRRLAFTEMILIAQINELPGIPMPLVPVVLEKHSTDEDDVQAMFENFTKWSSKG